MAIPLVITAWLFLNVEIFLKKKAIHIFGYTVLAVNAVYYLLRVII